MITDEMVEKAQKAWWGPQRDDYHPYQIAMRAALEAVAPMIIAEAFQYRPPAMIKEALDKTINRARAEGMREAAKIAVGAHDPRQMTLAERLLAIDARAQELDPQ